MIILQRKYLISMHCFRCSILFPWTGILQGMTAALPPLGENIDRCIIIIIIIIIICHQPLNVEIVSLQSTVISKHQVLAIYNHIIIANSNSIIW